LLDEYDRADSEWSQQVGIKIDEAISAADRIPPIDGETFVNGILERFQQIRQA
jgi:antitoxin ParD1/3/4